VSAEFVTTRVFDAPRERVWQAWAEAERLKQWFAPRGFTMASCELDLRVGGLFHYCLRTPEGRDMWGKWVIREIVKPEKLVFVVSFSDEKGGTTVHPMSPNWPREMLSTVEFKAQGKRTEITVRWIPINATEVERKTFDEGRDGMKQGWAGTLDYLVAYLAKDVNLKTITEK
jgi:uncharacterized protein YndB with AHSA1/START domain